MITKTMQINRAPDYLKDIVSDEKLRSIYLSISSIVLDSMIDRYDALVVGLERKAASDRDIFLAKMRAASRSVDVKNILEINTIKEIAQRYGIAQPVQFSQPVLHVSGKKITFGSTGVDAHQDWPSTLGSINSIIIWISLGGANEDGGGLFFYESDGPVRLLQGNVGEHVVTIDEAALQGYEKRYYAVEAGSALIFGHFIPHSSECAETRLSVSLRIEDASDLEWLSRRYEFAQATKISRKSFSASKIEEINDRIAKN
jgi:hypothetical protein